MTSDIRASEGRPGGSEERRTRLLYVTAQLPFGASEAFFLPEIEALGREGCDVTVVPVRGSGKLVHPEARRLIGEGTQGVVSRGIVRAAIGELRADPEGAIRPLRVLRESRSAAVFAKNSAVVPKALWVARRVRSLRSDHIHAHWAGTSATLAMIASELTGVPWSFTAHRWDIAENNLLRAKASRACFVRVISDHGADELRSIVGDPAWSPWVLRMGVRLPSRSASPRGPDEPLRILTAARFVEKKGHVHLVDAVARLGERGVVVRVELAGAGPLEESLRAEVRERGLGDEIVFLGNLAHERLLRDLESGRWHASVLPSVVTAAGELEGIPVSLIEAMAAGVPAIGTDTGGTAELLGEGAGLLVPPGDPRSLANAIESLARDPGLRARLSERGRARVAQEFAVDRVAAMLHARFRACAEGR